MRDYLRRSMAFVLMGVLIFSSVSFAETEKEEWVYVNLSATGEVENIIVNDWLHSDEQVARIIDQSDLTDIRNLKGDEMPVQSGNVLTWQVKDHDIYYQGKTDKTLPFDVTVIYTLDGVQVNPQDILKASGDLEIELMIENKTQINVDDQAIFLPMAVACVINLPNENYKNVTVNFGKMINDGDHQVITYLALPGLKKNLSAFGFAEDLIEMPSSLIIHTTVEQFEMGSIYMTARCELPDLKDLESIEGLDDFVNNIETLSTSSQLLVEGAQQLSSGQKTFNSRLNDFDKGLHDLNKGIAPLIAGSDTLTAGASQLANAQSQVITGLNQSTEAIAFLKAGKEKEIEFNRTQIVNLTNLHGGLTQLLIGLGKDGEAKALLDGLMQYISALKTLNEKSETFLAGLVSLEKGLSDIQAGASQIEAELNNLSEGSKQLSAGLSQLNGGSDKLLLASDLLLEGSQTLTQGTEHMSQKISQFDEEGIQTLSSNILEISNGIGDLEGLKSYLEKASASYKSFAGISPDMAGSVQFIVKTNEVKAEEIVVEHVETKTSHKKGFFTWLKDLF